MPRRLMSFHPSLAAASVLAIGLIATAVLFVGVRRLEHDKIELDFQQRANVRSLTVQQQLEESVQTLKVLNHLFTTVGPVSREQFQTFTQPMLERYPYVQAFNFHRFVDGGERPAYEAKMRTRYPDFILRQMQDGHLIAAPNRERHLVVDYIEPMRGNEAAFGLDVLHNARLLETVQYAIDTGRAAASDLLPLAQGGGTLRGLLIVMPVYRHDMALDNVAARRRAAIGDTAAVFNASSMIEKILGASGLLNDPAIGIRVYASDEDDEAQLAYQNGERPSQQAQSLLPQWLFLDQPEKVVHNFSIAGKPWHMEVYAAPMPFTARHSGSLYGLIAGVLFSVMAAAYLQAMSSRSRRIHRLIAERTAELRLANDRLNDDIAARKRAEAGLQLRQRAIDASPNAIIITSAVPPHFPIEYVNPAFTRITGYSTQDVVGQSLTLLCANDREQAGIQELRAAAIEQCEGNAVVRSYGKDGKLFWSDVYIAPVRDESGEANHFVVALYDITATRRYQDELEFQANRDTLTGLANRALLQDRLRQACVSADRYGQSVWVLFLNLDRFKFVNDTLGHRAGDKLLQGVAQRLRQVMAQADTIARLSADEFVLILGGRGHDKLSTALLQHLIEAIGKPIVIDGYTFVMGCSIGVSICPLDGSDPESLIKHAGIAMYRAKELGRNNYQFYTPVMNEHAMERLTLEGDLRHALERNEFSLHYQPQADLRTGSIIGMEALLRWQHPVHGMVSPARFIPMAEELGLIVPIGAWVLRTACRQNMAWQRAGYGPLRVAVNLSARQFYQQDLVASIKAILEETGLAPHLLELELTESMMMKDVEHAAAILRDLKAIGVQLSIDDFGTGYSSLAYLKRFPIDVLKIDQSFVRDITVDPDDAAIVLSIISLAHSLRLSVIAEGVETAAQLAYLRQHECDCMQGYYFSRPLPAGDCDVLLRQDRHLPMAVEVHSARTEEAPAAIEQ